MKRVCVQGLGYVGAAMATAIARARNRKNQAKYFVTGIDLPDESGRARVASINRGEFPFFDVGNELSDAVQKAHKEGNLTATTNIEAYKDADIVVVDVQLDIVEELGLLSPDFQTMQRAIEVVGRNVPEHALVIIETTVPPGTCDNIILPILQRCYGVRGFKADDVRLAHSYERVMPGENYLDSLVNYWRVYAANTEVAAKLCDDFLSSVINVKDYPLTQMTSMVASEAAKILENSYRAVNIAFINEWSSYAEQLGFDLYQVVDAIRVRETHSNIRSPGLGVGGYCLPKDPLFAPASVSSFFSEVVVDFPFTKLAVETNRKMPLRSVARLKELIDESLDGKSILLCGVSYRQNVGDTRNSPSEAFARSLFREGAIVDYHDPYVQYWREMSVAVATEIPDFGQYDIVVFAVPHRAYLTMDILSLIDSENKAPFIFDPANILSNEYRKELRDSGLVIEGIGRGVNL